VVASGLTLSAGCAGTTGGSPGAAPPAAPAAPAAPTPPSATAPSSAPSATPPATAAPNPTAPDPAADPASTSLELGAEGPAVGALQQRLADLGFWLGDADGNYGQLTRQAVMAFQKAEGITRDGVAGPQTQQHLQSASRPSPRDASGDHIEVDLERQLLLVVRGGQVHWALNTSTGNGEAYARPSGGSGVARTPRGDFAIERQINGMRRAELGNLYRPKYFRGGIAVHGSGSIPAHPASHGCVRVTNSAMDLLWSSGLAEIGTPVTVY
jgi:peptidoglycan hydrolase-like protein with peptidoglycan-binding domain